MIESAPVVIIFHLKKKNRGIYVSQGRVVILLDSTLCVFRYLLDSEVHMIKLLCLMGVVAEPVSKGEGIICNLRDDGLSKRHLLYQPHRMVGIFSQHQSIGFGQDYEEVSIKLKLTPNVLQ